MLTPIEAFELLDGIDHTGQKVWEGSIFTSQLIILFNTYEKREKILEENEMKNQPINEENEMKDQPINEDNEMKNQPINEELTNHPSPLLSYCFSNHPNLFDLLKIGNNNNLPSQPFHVVEIGCGAGER